MTPHTPTDSLRYLAAHCADVIDHVSQQLCRPPGEGMSEDETEYLLDRLDTIRVELREHLAAHTDRPRIYDDGRPVKSSIELEFGYVYEHVWHPDRAHEFNQPGVAIPNAECASGTRRSVLVTAGEGLAVHPRG
jgi:hypothetical protein